MTPYWPSNLCQVSLVTLGASKNKKSRMSRNSMKFDGVARFFETIPTVKSVSSSEIYENSEFSTGITVLPFLRKLNFLGFYILPPLKEFRPEMPHVVAHTNTFICNNYFSATILDNAPPSSNRKG